MPPKLLVRSCEGSTPVGAEPNVSSCEPETYGEGRKGAELCWEWK